MIHPGHHFEYFEAAVLVLFVAEISSECALVTQIGSDIGSDISSFVAGATD